METKANVLTRVHSKKILMSAMALAFSLSVMGCHAQESKPAAPIASSIATPANEQASTPLVTGLPDFTRLVDFVTPAVVNIRVSEKIKTSGTADLRNHPICKIWPDVPICNSAPAPVNPDAPTERISGQGSGFITSADGYILTNNHVIAGASTLMVVMPDKREFKAKVIGTDARTDVAVIKIEASGLPFLKMANSDALRVGEWVMAAGSPFGLKNTVTAGVVSAINRDTGDYLSFIQTDAAVNPGNSGGPLVNMSGEVVGINSQILSPSGAFSGIAFAIPINDALRIAEQLRAKGKVEHGRIGVGIEPVSETLAKKLGMAKAQGVVITQVEANSAAAQGGLQAGDVVTRVGNVSIESVGDFARTIGETRPGTQLQFEVWRDARAQNLTLTVAQGK